jgi:hypothetical protein
LCARGPDKWCSLAEQSWSALDALSLRIQDYAGPAVGIGGELIAGGWRRGAQNAALWSADGGSGLRFGEVRIDGSIVARTEFPCAKTYVAGTWAAVQMRPCQTEVGTNFAVPTSNLSDGPHTASTCVADFAENVACTADHTVLVDNNPPASPRAVAIAGGEGWHRVDDFDVSWTDPDQGPASPVAAALWQVTGPAGYDTGVRAAEGRGITALPDLKVPGPGAYALRLWLRDEAGNDSPATAVSVPLRFDEAAPSVAFAPGAEDSVPDAIRAGVADPLAGPASGTISYRKPDGADWIELPTKLQPGGPGQATLVAPTPELAAPGLYLFRAEAADAAGNAATSTLRGDGTRMAIRRAAAAPGPAGPGAPGGARAKVRLFARLRGGGGKGAGRALRASGRDGSLTVPFGAAALLAGRLTSARGAGIAGRRLRVVARPSRGALVATTRETLTTGKRGGFELRLGPGPSRRVAVYFGGGDGLAAARRTDLDLRVRSGVSLSAEPTALETGQEVHLSGRVRGRGAPIPRRGKLVAIQYLEAATHRWRPVLVVRSDHGGRFHTRYRFRYVSGAARIQLRATALAEERWPYAPGSSRPVTVDVRGR